jgi:hypothetical protein
MQFPIIFLSKLSIPFVMGDLNITYYFGEIKPEYRGRYVLFMSIPENPTAENPNYRPDFAEIPITDSHELVHFTEQCSSMRAYIGVSEAAKPALEKRFQEGKLSSAFDLDAMIVSEEKVKERAEAVSGLSCSCLRAVMLSGK